MVIVERFSKILWNITNSFGWFPVRKVVVEEGILRRDVNLLQLGVNNKPVGVEKHPGIHCYISVKTTLPESHLPRSQDISPVAVGEIPDYRVTDVMTVNT